MKITTLEDIELVPTTVRYMVGGSNELHTREESRAELCGELAGQPVTVVCANVYGEPFVEHDRFVSAQVRPRAGGGYSPWELGLSLRKVGSYRRDFPVEPVILLRGDHALDLNSIGLPPIEILGAMRVHCESYDVVWAMVSDYCATVAGAAAVLIDTSKAAIAHHRTWLTKFNSREAWAARQLYWDDASDAPYHDQYSRKLSDHATPTEVAKLTTALKDLYRELGQQLREANIQAGPLLQQKGEGGQAHYRRIKTLPEEEQQKAYASGRLKNQRQDINVLLGQIVADKIPNSHVSGTPREWIAPILRTLCGRVIGGVRAVETRRHQ